MAEREDRSDVEADLAEVNRITAMWIVDDRPTKFEPRRPTKTFISKVPAALNCLNRAAKDLFDPDQAYEFKFRALLICARLGWARDCADGDGYRVDRYMFHLPVPIDCTAGNEVEFRNLDQSRIDDPERAVAILEQFLESHPLTEDEEEELEHYREHQERERQAYEERCARRAELEAEFVGDCDEDDEDDWA